MTRVSSRAAWSVGLGLGVPRGVAGLVGRSRRVLEPLSDEALLVPLAQRFHHPEDLAGDAWLDLAAQVFSHAYSALLGTVLEVVADPQLAVGTLAVAAMVVHVAGLTRLLGGLGGRAATVWGLVALVVVPAIFDPTFQAAVGGPFAWGTTRLAAFSLGPGDGLPRDLVFAGFPWLLVALERRATASLRRRLVPYLALGLVANLHPLTAVHLALVAGLLELSRDRSVAGLRFGALSVVAFGLAASPYVVQYLAAPRIAGGADPAVAAWRVFGIHGETASAWVARMEPLLLLGVLAAGVWPARGGDERDREARRLLLVGAVVLLVAAAAPLIAWLAEPLRAFQFQRLGRPAAVLLVVGTVVRLLDPARRRSRPVRGAAVLCGAYLLGVAVLAWLPGPVSPLHRLVRRWERAQGVAFTPPAPEGLVERDVAVDPSGSDALSRAFRAVADAARERVRPGETVLVPPETFGAFRGYVRRPTSVTRKEGGFAVTFLGGHGRRWFAEYRDAVATYAAGDDARWRSLARLHDASHAVVEDGVAVPPEWRRVFEAPPYRLLRIP